MYQVLVKSCPLDACFKVILESLGVREVLAPIQLLSGKDLSLRLSSLDLWEIKLHTVKSKVCTPLPEKVPPVRRREVSQGV